MDILRAYLSQKSIQKTLNKRPGDKGFSLVELVVVIAVLAILSAIAIPAFTQIQVRARTSAVKNGLVNGIKECIVVEGLEGFSAATFDKAQAWVGSYNSYTIGADSQTSCFQALAAPEDPTAYPWFRIVYNRQDGTTAKTCNYIAGNNACSSTGTW